MAKFKANSWPTVKCFYKEKATSKSRLVTKSFFRNSKLFAARQLTLGKAFLGRAVTAHSKLKLCG